MQAEALAGPRFDAQHATVLGQTLAHAGQAVAGHHLRAAGAVVHVPESARPGLTISLEEEIGHLGQVGAVVLPGDIQELELAGEGSDAADPVAAAAQSVVAAEEAVAEVEEALVAGDISEDEAEAAEEAVADAAAVAIAEELGDDPSGPEPEEAQDDA